MKPVDHYRVRFRTPRRVPRKGEVRRGLEEFDVEERSARRARGEAHRPPPRSGEEQAQWVPEIVKSEQAADLKTVASPEHLQPLCKRSLGHLAPVSVVLPHGDEEGRAASVALLTLFASAVASSTCTRGSSARDMRALQGAQFIRAL